MSKSKLRKRLRSRNWSPAVSSFPLIRDFRLLFWADLSLRTAQTYAPHAHPHHQLTVIALGKCRVMIHDKWYAARRGHCLFIPSGARHSFKIAANDVDYRAIQFRFHIPNEARASINLPFRSDLALRPKLLRLVETIREHISSRNTIDVMLGQLQFISLLLHLSREYGRGNREPRSGRLEIDPALRAIHARFAGPHTLATLAARCRLSMSRFSHLFSQTLGMGPMAYLREIRLNQARQLLNSPATSISKVARQVGYASHHYFSRDFRKRCGLSPSEYRVLLQDYRGNSSRH